MTNEFNVGKIKLEDNSKKIGNISIPIIKGEQGNPGTNGKDGFSPTISEKTNTDEEYILEITDVNGKKETPNLKRKNIYYWDGQSSIQNPNNIALFQQIIDDYLAERKVFIAIGNSKLLYVLDLEKVHELEGIGYCIDDSIDYISNIEKGIITQNQISNIRIEISETEPNKVIGVTCDISIKKAEFLDTYNISEENFFEAIHDSQPVSKGYLNKRIVESLSSISKLTPTIVDTLPDIEKANSNILYLLSKEDADENDLYSEYLFINGKFEPIGTTNIASADLSNYVKKDEISVICYWDGQSTSQNPNNVEFFQDIINRHLEGKNIIIIYSTSNNERTYIYNFKKDIMPTLEYDDYICYKLPSFLDVRMNVDNDIKTKTIDILNTTISININKLDNSIKSVEYLENEQSATVLDAAESFGSDTEYFSAEKNSDPISKGYLDKIIKLERELQWPIGRGFIDFTNTDYSNYLGFTWERELVGMFPVGYNPKETEFNTIGKTGGEKTHKLTLNELPKHSPGYMLNFKSGEYSHWGPEYNNSSEYWFIKPIIGNDQGHNNLPPYKVVAYWKRVS